MRGIIHEIRRRRIGLHIDACGARRHQRLEIAREGFVGLDVLFGRHVFLIRDGAREPIGLPGLVRDHARTGSDGQDGIIRVGGIRIQGMGIRLDQEFQREPGFRNTGRKDNIHRHGLSFCQGDIVLGIHAKLIRLERGQRQGAGQASFPVGESDLLLPHFVVAQILRILGQCDGVLHPARTAVERGICTGLRDGVIPDISNRLRIEVGRTDGSLIGGIVGSITAWIIVLDQRGEAHALVHILDIDARRDTGDLDIPVTVLVEIRTLQVLEVDLDRRAAGHQHVRGADVQTGGILGDDRVGLGLGRAVEVVHGRAVHRRYKALSAVTGHLDNPQFIIEIAEQMKIDLVGELIFLVHEIRLVVSRIPGSTGPGINPLEDNIRIIRIRVGTLIEIVKSVGPNHYAIKPAVQIRRTVSQFLHGDELYRAGHVSDILLRLYQLLIGHVVIIILDTVDGGIIGKTVEIDPGGIFSGTVRPYVFGRIWVVRRQRTVARLVEHIESLQLKVVGMI